MFVLAALPGCLASAAAACACSCCTLATRSALRSSARVAVSLLFAFSLLFSWALRDYAKPLISRIPWIVRHFAGAGAPPDAWFGQQAVLRLSLGNALLFGGFAFAMAFPGPVRTRGDWRDRGLHHSSYLLKVALWAACSAAPFFLPNGAVAAYALLARAASPLFLGLQVRRRRPGAASSSCLRAVDWSCSKILAATHPNQPTKLNPTQPTDHTLTPRQPTTPPPLSRS